MSHYSHLFVHVGDLARTRAFYVGGLGLAALVEDDTGYLRLGDRDGLGFHLGVREGEDVGAPGIEIVIRVPDVDAAYREMRERGVVFDTEPADMPWGARHAWLRDPDGYRLSIYS